MYSYFRDTTLVAVGLTEDKLVAMAREAAIKWFRAKQGTYPGGLDAVPTISKADGHWNLLFKDNTFHYSHTVAVDIAGRLVGDVEIRDDLQDPPQLAEYLRIALTSPPAGGSPTELIRIYLDSPDRIGHSAFQNACKPLQADLRKRYEASADQEPSVRLPLALACMYAGGSLTAADVEDLIAKAGGPGRVNVSISSWGENIARTGNPEGLKLILTGARQWKCAADLICFEYLVGKSEQARITSTTDRRLRLTEKELLAEVESCRTWLAENAKGMVFDEKTKRFQFKSALRNVR